MAFVKTVEEFVPICDNNTYINHIYFAYFTTDLASVGPLLSSSRLAPLPVCFFEVAVCAAVPVHGGRGRCRCFDKVIATKAAMTSVTWHKDQRFAGGQGGHENPGGFGAQGLLECSMIQRQKLLSYIDMNFLGRIGRCFQAIGRDFFQGLG